MGARHVWTCTHSSPQAVWTCRFYAVPPLYSVHKCQNAGLSCIRAVRYRVTEWKKMQMPEPVGTERRGTSPVPEWVRYRTDMSDAGMSMPRASALMPMPSYIKKRGIINLVMCQREREQGAQTSIAWEGAGRWNLRTAGELHHVGVTTMTRATYIICIDWCVSIMNRTETSCTAGEHSILMTLLTAIQNLGLYSKL
jgi:hypothetical protein